MTHSKRSCSILDPIDIQFEPELRDILNALFCSCLEELQSSDALLRRDLFRLTEIKGQTLAAAARALGISVQDAAQMLTQTRREVAVLMVLGLGKPSRSVSADDPKFLDCNCRDA
jgi:predicted DNA-binding protein (UPF0251 family)